ncbi:YlmC/YmxH family sporulation protein [Paenibacillus sp. P96]|uniref:YlmC/YmxH family sporulation protein n=1 Tax=Paenibacillus zeirhizosphaerae TaxID=2987519 RepID=A0ABT9FQC4_9BACL|nr:YlmC/YmxH family sporulation protein [Paenibacillus sp. P96]MDP4096925.1 YlmC/YmxH family sporulation protein [Paenibacillus sp. P96]
MNVPDEGLYSIKISDFQSKDVINIMDGRRLGQICDLEIDPRLGRIEAIVMPVPGGFFGLFRARKELVIPWHNIVKIGPDVILVRHEYIEEWQVEEHVYKTGGGVRGIWADRDTVR